MTLAAAVALGALAAQANVTISLSKTPLRKALTRVEQVSNLHFFYKSDLAGLNTPVTITADNEADEAFLSRLLEGTGLTYEIDKSGNVTLTPRHARDNASTQESAKPTITLTGTVKDDDGEPLIGAGVKVHGSNTGVVTDIDGHYTLSGVRPGSTVEVSFVGYTPQDFKATASGTHDFTLTTSSTELNEVVVVGYGQQKKINLTGAVAVVKAKDVNGRPTGSAATALQGADPSLNLKMSSGGPDASASLNIRGTTSINGGSPLVLVDGVEMNLTRVNANDIESISILKDASAAAVYGATVSYTHLTLPTSDLV